MSTVPDVVPGVWNIEINKSATWPSTTISMTRDGVAVIPDSAALRFYSPDDGSLLLTINATIDGGGLMTIPGLTSSATNALTWDYASNLFTTTEGDGTITDLLAGNTTVRNYAD